MPVLVHLQYCHDVYKDKGHNLQVQDTVEGQGHKPNAKVSKVSK